MGREFRRACAELAREFGPGLGPEIKKPATLGARDEEKAQDVLLADRLAPRIMEIASGGGPGLSELAEMPRMLGLRAADASAMSWAWFARATSGLPKGGARGEAALRALLAPWLLRGKVGDTHGAKSKGAGACAAEALSRCSEEGPAFGATMRAISRFAEPSGAHDCESASDAVGLAIGRALPGALQAAIESAAGSLGPRFVPTFASRLGSRFEAAWRERPERAGAIDESARRYLEWCEGLDMDRSDYPSVNRWPSIWGSVVAREALAPTVARLWRRRAELHGERLGKEELARSQSLLGGIEMAEGDAPLWELGWDGRLFTPVDQAIFSGSLGAARALRALGVPWDARAFVDLMAGLGTLDGLRSDGPEEPNELLARARAVGEALALEEGVGGARAAGAKEARRL